MVGACFRHRPNVVHGALAANIIQVPQRIPSDLFSQLSLGISQPRCISDRLDFRQEISMLANQNIAMTRSIVIPHMKLVRKNIVLDL
jgi:hypothetical protein